MKKFILSLGILALTHFCQAQVNPAVSAFLQNTTETGSYYTIGNSTTQSNGILVNCQKVEYSADFVYVTATGIPSYPTGPFQGNPSNATNQNSIFKIPLNPQPNTGTAINSTPGNIGIFVNGVALFDYRDGVAWNPNTNALCGGPGNSPCPGGMMASSAWNRDAIPAERGGFDCAKGHPAMGNYHHHQNPSAFNLDIEVVSTICNLYDAEGLYVMDSTKHSPLLGFAYDGFPIYGAYGFKNTDGTGGITRIKSGYQGRNITARTHYADGTDVADGPAVNATYFLGYFREDYEFVSHPGQADYLDVHNGRTCITPEYPNGTYAYFATVDANWNSAYPYVVGPTFYGNATNRKVTSVTEPTTVYTPGSSDLSEAQLQNLGVTILPNPAADLIAVQLNDLVRSDLNVQLLDITGKVVRSTSIKKGSTIAYFDVQSLYEGVYLVRIAGQNNSIARKVLIAR